MSSFIGKKFQILNNNFIQSDYEINPGDLIEIIDTKVWFDNTVDVKSIKVNDKRLVSSIDFSYFSIFTCIDINNTNMREIK